MKSFGGFIRLKRQAAKVSYFFISQEKIRFLTKTSKGVSEYFLRYFSFFFAFVGEKNNLIESRNSKSIFIEKNEDSHVHGFSNLDAGQP